MTCKGIKIRSFHGSADQCNGQYLSIGRAIIGLDRHVSSEITTHNICGPGTRGVVYGRSLNKAHKAQQILSHLTILGSLVKKSAIRGSCQ